MREFVRRRPSPAMVVSLVALVIAASGTAVAATTQQNGDKLIAKHTLSGNRLVNHTLTRKQINLSKLGTVPSATNAAHAATSDHATTAAQLQGLIRWRNTISSPGASSTSPNTVTLATVGPFTILGECWLSSGKAHAATFIQTSQAGDSLDSYNGAQYDNNASGYNSDITSFGPSSGALQVTTYDEAPSGTSASPEFFGSDDGSWAAETNNGSLALNGFASQGVYNLGSTGPACSFAGFMVTE